MIIHSGRASYLVEKDTQQCLHMSAQPSIGAPDRSLTPNAALAVITELCERLGVYRDAGSSVVPIKLRVSRLRGRGAAGRDSGGELPVRLPDRAGPARADAAGQQITPVPRPASTTAAGLARLVPRAVAAVESGWRGEPAGFFPLRLRTVGGLALVGRSRSPVHH